MADTPITVTRAVPSLAVPNTTSVLDRAIAVTKGDLQPASSSVFGALVMVVVSASIAPSPKVVNLAWQQGTLGVSVGTVSLEPLVYTVGGQNVVTRDAGAVSLVGSNVALTLGVAGALSIPVVTATTSVSGQDVPLEENRFFDAAAIAPAGKIISLRKGTPVISAVPSILGQSIALVNANSQTIGVGTVGIAPSPKSVVLSKTWSTDVTSVALAPNGSNIGFSFLPNWLLAVDSTGISPTAFPVALNSDVAVTSAALSVPGSDIGLTLAAQVETGQVNLFGKDIILSRTETFPFTAAGFSILGKQAVLDITIDAGVVPAQTEFTFGPSGIVLNNSIIVGEALPSIAASSIDFVWTKDFVVSVEISPAEEDFLSFFVHGQSIGLSLTFTLGIVPDPAQLLVSGSGVDLFLGSGAPTEIKESQSSPSIQISFGAPITTHTESSGSIQIG